MSSGRRPWRSPRRPETIEKITDVMLAAPMASPTPTDP